MTLPLVIVNPTSAGGATGSAWPKLASDLSSYFGSFKNVFTKGTGDATALASEAARKDTPLIIACGGDGTISEVANGILNSGKDVELGILPSGTGGDFRRSLEIPSQPRAAAHILKTGRTRTNRRWKSVIHRQRWRRGYSLFFRNCFVRDEHESNRAR